MYNKKLVTILALTGVVANLGLATAFAQSTTTGSQTITCPTEVSAIGTGRTSGPANFSFPNANVSNFYSTTTSTASFGASALDAIEVTSNTPSTCGSEQKVVTLQAQANNQFFIDVNANNTFDPGEEILTNYGADNTAANADDKGAILSISHSAAVCSDSTPGATFCALAAGSSMTSSTVNGTTNVFASVSSSATAPGYVSANALLTPTDNAVSSAPGAVTLFTATQGFDGSILMNDLDYSIALPANLRANATAYTTRVTYTVL